MDALNYIITGGGGSGKTSLINALSKQGYKCFPEVSRQIIAEQQKINGDLMPWENLNNFGYECLRRMEKQLDKIHYQPTFYDRGIPDIIAYYKTKDIKASRLFYSKLKLYNQKVFLCPPWQDIFTNDAQRPESFEYAKNIYDLLRATYKELGFHIIEVPKMNVESRTNFIANHIEKMQEIRTR